MITLAAVIVYIPGATSEDHYLTNREAFTLLLQMKKPLLCSILLLLCVKKLRVSDWLKTSVFFMQHECKIVTRVQSSNTRTYYK